MNTVMRKKGIITVIMLLAVIAAALAVRVFYVAYVMDRVNVDEQLLTGALIKENGAALTDIFAEGFSARAFYGMCLSASCMLFGNFAVAGVYLNVAMQVIAAVLLFGTGVNFLNRYLGLLFGAVFSLLPIAVEQVSAVDVSNFSILLAALILWLISVAVCAVRYLCGKKRRAACEPLTEEEQEKSTESPQTQPEAVFDSSMKEIVLEEAEEQKPRFIENPLPVPKRREHKEMDYAIEIDARDDYDIMDMAGKDFFDIE